MIYIIEGMDNCGKSTLIDRLVNKNQNPHRMIVHSVKPPKCQDVEQWSLLHYLGCMREFMELSSRGWDIYLDRSYLGDAVYGPLYRSTDASWVFDLEKKLKLDEFDISLLVLVGEVSGLVKRDDGLSLSLENLDKERKLFTDVFNKSTICEKTLINVDLDGFSKVDAY